MSIVKTEFGKSQNGESVYLYTVTNGNGTIMKVTNYGAILQSVIVKDKNGNMTDVVLGCDNVEEYYDNGPSLGAVVGRNANRIGGAKVVINAITYELAKNDNGKNNLHSGPDLFQNRVWDAEEFAQDGQGVEFTLVSLEMDQGYPGNFSVSVKYTLTDDDAVMITYNATSDADTIANMTNDSYFNLEGHDAGSVLDNEVYINSDAFTLTDSELIPTGELCDVTGTPMDFREMKKLGRDIDASYEPLILAGGYDHNYVLKNEGNNELVAKLHSEKTGITMEVYTDLPGIQLYTGNFLGGDKKGKGGHYYKKRDGVCFESQYFPDANNHENFASTILKAGEVYNTTTVYKFVTE